MSDEQFAVDLNEGDSQILFGLPVVVTDAVPKGEILLGRFPTQEEVALYGSFETAIQAQKDQWAKIKITETDD